MRVTLLSLAPTGARVQQVLAALERAGIAGCMVLTHPAELALNGTHKVIGDASVLIIDSPDCPGYDVLHLIAVMRGFTRMGIIVLVKNHRERLRTVAAGADLGLRLPLAPECLDAQLRELFQYYGSTAEGHIREAGGQTLCNGDHMAGDDDTGDDADFEPDSPSGERNNNAGIPPETWRLNSAGWVLESPDHRSLVLTSQERALLAAMLGNPGNRITHAHWRQLNPAYERAAGAGALAVIISRLRGKAAAQELTIPIRADRREHAYQFCAPCAISTPAKTAPTRGHTDAGARKRETPDPNSARRAPTRTVPS
ncbi:hypothetical protein R69746_07986 [Paraburkholderia aspalathi]|uniref:helix-turn-helix domain-containing protein n=1 Tax=Paraburkholderia aspalathi TaxID=1324617 RepID=UPI00190B4020|nr:helix-turn-helix domain-containing protein [Paraburkholderia aspalathi]MBK3843952.1 helix-turn-helix domain-containing protein [Paraburkholderia aspalathi]CAE6864242.1 hypothetical protein R69746_07986 [Paraburkholderia aspalathi]CAE6870879.1 hypothetical protein R75465_08266 [Paraburkholderia aspalathi]